MRERLPERKCRRAAPVLAAALLAAFAAAARAEDLPPEPPAAKGTDYPYSGMPEAWKPWHMRSAETEQSGRAGVYQQGEVTWAIRLASGFNLLNAPLHVGGNETLHGGLLIPALREAWSLPYGIAQATGRYEMDFNSVSYETPTQVVQIDGRFSELAFHYRHGVGYGFELSAGLTSAGWGLNDDLILINNDSVPLIGEDNVTAPIVTNLLLGTKLELYSSKNSQSTYAAALDLKIPLAGKDQLATSGNADVAFTLLGSWNLKPVVVHANVGYVFTGKQVFPEGAQKLKDVWFVGVGAAYPLSNELAAVAQIQAHSSAYDFLSKDMKGPIVTLALGPRIEVAQDMLLDVGFGVGITPSASTFLICVELGRLIGWTDRYLPQRKQ